MHISKQPNGKWRVIVQDGGRRRSKVTATEREARRAGARLMVELGQQPDASDATLLDVLEIHMAEGDLANTTREDYRFVLAKLPQWMRDWKLTSITPMMLDQAYKRLLEEGWSVHRVRRLHGFVSPSLSRAARWGWIAHNPALLARPPAKPDSRVHAPDPAEVAALIALADEKHPAFGCALRVAAMTGCRRGELCALKWDDIREDRGDIIIRRSVSTTKMDPHHVTTGKTGSKGWRVVALTPHLTKALRSHKARQAEWALRVGIPAPEWLFTTDGVKPWRTDYVTTTFTRLRNELGVDVHMHMLRHFVATELIGAGVDLRTVAGRLGHSRPSVTSDIYASFLPANDQKAADYLGERLFGKSG